MPQESINLEIMSFVETTILPRYAEFGVSHGLQHVTRVITKSVDLARRIGADVNMAYVVAAYHDLGMSGPRAIHHITGGKILYSDARLKKWFSPDQLKIMKEAVEDHRASASHQPRSIYGKIVAEADRDMEPMVVFTRTVQYGFEHYPEMSKEEHWKRFEEHMMEKYSEAGYIKLWIPNSPNETYLRQLRSTIANKTELRQVFEKIYEIEKER